MSPMTTYNATEVDRLVREGQEAIDRRGECAGPLTTFDRERGTSTVGIVCRDNWDDVIRWLACCERVFPRALAALSAAKAEVERLTKIGDIHLGVIASDSSARDNLRDQLVAMEADRDRLAAEVEELRAVIAATARPDADTEALWRSYRRMAGQYLDEKNALAAEVERLTKERDRLRGATEAQGKLLAELPPSANQLIMAEMEAAVARTERDALSARVRELELTEEDREALEFARKVCAASESLFGDRMHDPKVAAHVERCRASVALLDRLAKGGR